MRAPGPLGWSESPRWGGSRAGRAWESFCPSCAQAFPRTVRGHLLVWPCVPERFWYCRLALNHKVLHYGDLDDNPQGEVTFESLQEKSRFILHCCIIVAGLDVRRPEFPSWCSQADYLVLDGLSPWTCLLSLSEVISTWPTPRGCSGKSVGSPMDMGV